MYSYKALSIIMSLNHNGNTHLPSNETERACILSKAELGACVLSEKRVWTAIILFLLFVIFCNRIFSINELSANEILYIESIIERIQ